LTVVKRGEHEDVGRARPCLDGPDGIEAAHPAHVDIEQNHIGSFLAWEGIQNRFGGRKGSRALDAAPENQQTRQERAKLLVVVHQPHPEGAAIRPRSSPILPILATVIPD
jgi:hypothetical protein